MKQLILLIIKFYQFFISPWLGTNCCYIPTCSEYTKDAVNNFGVLRGVFLGFKRILKCNPFSAGGYDPIVKTSTNLIKK